MLIFCSLLLNYQLAEGQTGHLAGSESIRQNDLKVVIAGRRAGQQIKPPGGMDDITRLPGSSGGVDRFGQTQVEPGLPGLAGLIHQADMHPEISRNELFDPPVEIEGNGG